jgi:hypothetical protein
MKPSLSQLSSSPGGETQKEKEKEAVYKGDATPPKHKENARKVQKLLKKRREMLAEQKQKVDGDRPTLEKPQKDGKNGNSKSEPTSSEDDEEEDDEQPETLTENSESYDSNESLRRDEMAKEIELKG